MHGTAVHSATAALHHEVYHCARYSCIHTASDEVHCTQYKVQLCTKPWLLCTMKQRKQYSCTHCYCYFIPGGSCTRCSCAHNQPGGALCIVQLCTLSVVRCSVLRKSTDSNDFRYREGNGIAITIGAAPTNPPPYPHACSLEIVSKAPFPFSLKALL